MSNSKLVISDNQVYYCRLQLLRELIEKVLRKYFHEKFSEDPENLYVELQIFKKRFDELLRKKVIKNYEYMIIFPEKDNKTYSSLFDTPILIHLLFECCGYTRPTKKLKDNNITRAANFVRLQNTRNTIQHQVASNTTYDVYILILHGTHQPLLDLDCTQDEIDKIERTSVVDSKTQHKISQLEKTSRIFDYNFQAPPANFIGREEKIKELHKALVEAFEDIDFMNQTYGVVLVGMPGTGKSVTCQKYWMEHMDDYYEQIVLWINGESRDSIIKSFRDIGERCGLEIRDKEGAYLDIEVILRKVYTHFTTAFTTLKSSTRKILFIFDNVPDKKLMKDFLAPSASVQPYILITSQYNVWESEKYKVVKLDVFEPEVAIEFVRTNLENELAASSSNELIGNLCEETLGRHPLALKQAVSYINESKINIPEYLEAFKEHQNELMLEDSDGEESIIYSTFSMCLKKLQDKSKKDDALKFLKIIAYLDGARIDKALLLAFMKKKDMKTFQDVLNLLKSYSIIDMSDSSVQKITIHSLFQCTLQKKQERNEKCAILKEILQIWFADLNGSILKGKLVDAASLWYHHLVYMFSKVQTTNEMLLETQGNHFDLVELFHAKQDLAKLKEMLKVLLKYYRDEGLDKAEPKYQKFMLNVKHNIALCDYKMYHFQDARRQCEKVDRAKTKFFKSQNHPSVLLTKSLLASCLQRTDDTKLSLILYGKVLEDLMKWYTDSNSTILHVKHQMAVCYKDVGDHEKALEAFRLIEKSDRQRESVGEEDNDTDADDDTDDDDDVEEGDNLLDDDQQRTFKEYKELESRDLETSSKAKSLPTDSLKTQHQIGNCLTSLNRAREALKVFRSVDESMSKTLGPEHPDTINNKYSLASCLYAEGLYGEALTLFFELAEFFGKDEQTYKEFFDYTNNYIYLCNYKRERRW